MCKLFCSNHLFAATPKGAPNCLKPKMRHVFQVKGYVVGE
jgi:hypothetical protein